MWLKVLSLEKTKKFTSARFSNEIRGTTVEYFPPENFSRDKMITSSNVTIPLIGILILFEKNLTLLIKYVLSELVLFSLTSLITMPSEFQSESFSDRLYNTKICLEL